ncbi:MAG: dynamin family protein [Desulfosudaceae bacterium]
MDKYNDLKERLLALSDESLRLIDTVENASGVTDTTFENWKDTCRGIKRQVAEDLVRVAVVGPIKSGKSTIVNSLFKQDYLKRGAGVITAMVTKARRSDRLGATLFFKSWDEVNAEIARAVVMLPSSTLEADGHIPDIRHDSTRETLSRFVDELPQEYLIARDSRNINSVLLANYLEGYEAVRDILAEETVTRRFEREDFARHRDFVAEDRLAVYLKDIQLEIDSGDMDPGIEMADCQGSDSPNPMHLAKIQDYLLLTNLIVYVISSRTGIRQADINFLTMIRRMGIADNLIFVINCDFNEHESLDGLKSLVGRIAGEIALIQPDPEVHVFSGLYNLFRSQGKGWLSDKDARMLTQWELETELASYSDEGTRAFEASLYYQLNRRRYALLLENHVGRFSLVISGLHQWATVNLGMLAEDEQSVADIIASTRHHKSKLEQAGDLFKSTLEGSSRKLKKELKAECDRFFDARAGDILPDVLSFIRGWKADLGKYESSLATSGFSNTLYMIFQEFKQDLDTFMTKTINPRLMGFIKKMESRISAYFESIAASYDNMARDALSDYKKGMEQVGMEMDAIKQPVIKARDLEIIKTQHGLDLPPAEIIMNYTTKIRTEAVMRLGVYSAGRLIKKIFKRSPQNDRTNELRALKDGISRIKNETEKTITFHFKSYRENIKFQYVFKLVDGVSQGFHEAMLDRFSTYSADISHLHDALSEKRVDKEQLSAILNQTKETAAAAMSSAHQLAREIEAADQNDDTGDDRDAFTDIQQED